MTQKSEFQQLIEDNEVDITKLPSITQAEIAEYNKLSIEENPDEAKLDKLDSAIWNAVMDYVEPEEEQAPEVKEETTATTTASTTPAAKTDEPKSTASFPTAVKEEKKEESKDRPLFQRLIFGK